MVRMRTRTRVLTLSFAAMLVVGACGSAATSSPAASAGAAASGAAASAAAGASSAPSAAAASAGPTAGGTLYMLTSAQQFDQVDPQRAYTGEDLAFFGGTIYRGLEAFTFSTDSSAATKLTPDLATDLGTATDGGKTWAFTLRDGVTFQDGSPITCADVAYGISRTFATDVINQGPTYQIQYLDIPTDKDGSSSYKGPYKGTGQALYDKAVTCSADGKTITFHLNQPLGDWNYATTLGMFPVPKAADTGETYATTKVLPVSSGPYMVQSYATGNGGKMILVRNPKWNQASDFRHAYPDKWEIDFGIDAKVIDQRLIQSSGNDTTAMEYGGIQPENLSIVFSDPKTPSPQFVGRAVSDYDIYVRYMWIDTTKVSNVKIRQAMAVALDRAAFRKAGGGDFFGTMADGLIKPNVGPDYTPTGLWDTLLGQKIPDSGDIAYAKQLIAESGVAAPALTYDYPQTPVGDKYAAIVISSLGAAGFKVTPNPIERGKYYSVVFGKSAHEFGYAGWGIDWPRASTVIPPLLTVKGGWDLSRLDDSAYNAQVAAALAETDPTKQSADWQALNTLASKNMYTIPLIFELTQRLAGTKVGGIYLWAPYGSWPYGDMYVKQ
jgi:peptide/nickel transport system substrate-binding protein